MSYIGFVEIHRPGMISGWCIDKEDPTTPVKIDLYCEDVLVRSFRAENYRPDIASRYKSPKSGFSFAIQDSLEKLLPAGTLINVRTPDGNTLPLLREEGVTHVGYSNGIERLKEKFEKGFIIDKWGSVKQPFKSMSKTKRKSYALGMRDMSEYFSERFGITLFLHYGSLLGFARGGLFIDHDDDTDMSYVIRASSLEEVSNTFYSIAHVIKDDGHDIRVDGTGQMHIKLKSSKNPGTDVFASWLEPNSMFYTYFGVGGILHDPFAIREGNIEGVTCNVPLHYKRLLECTYGPQWKTPDPEFQWYTPQGVLDKMNSLKSFGASSARIINIPR